MEEKQKIQVVLVDDEQDSSRVLELLFKKYIPNVEVIAKFSDSFEALRYLQDNPIDLLFLDIEMPRMNGFELLEALQPVEFKTILVTAYDDYGIKAVKSKIYDYLVKPIDKDDLKACIDRFELDHQKDENDVGQAKIDTQGRIILPTGNEYEFIDIDSIIRCESDDNYSQVYYGNNQRIMVSRTLKFVEESLPSDQFLRVHSKHLINIHRIQKYVKSDGGYFLIDTQEKIPLSRYRKDEILRKLGLKG